MKKVNEICPTTTQEWIQKGALLADVREENEIAELSFDVPNIATIPFSKFEERFHELPKDQYLVMVCALGIRSYQAAGILLENGYDKVVNMKYGIVRWVEKGFPTKGDVSFIFGDHSGCCCTEMVKDNNAAGNSDKTAIKNSCC